MSKYNANDYLFTPYVIGGTLWETSENDKRDYFSKRYKKVKDVLEAEQDKLTEVDYKIIDVRKANHLKRVSQSFSWEEAKERVLKL